MRILKLIVVEYSLKQKAFHVHKVSEMVKINFANIKAKRTIDYLPLGIFETQEQADDFISKMRPIIEK